LEFGAWNLVFWNLELGTWNLELEFIPSRIPFPHSHRSLLLSNLEFHLQEPS
jgi:hypothetical protein